MNVIQEIKDLKRRFNFFRRLYEEYQNQIKIKKLASDITDLTEWSSVIKNESSEESFSILMSQLQTLIGGGSLLHSLKIKLADYTIEDTDEYIIADATSENVILTLPEISSSLDGKLYYIIVVNTDNGVSIKCTGSDLFSSGGATWSANDRTYTFIANNSNKIWYYLYYA